MFRLATRFWKTNRIGEVLEQTVERFLLWVDAVGGYWICPNDNVTLGQSSRNSAIDVPILGDVSGRHAQIRRDGEVYVVEAIRDVYINERPVSHLATVSDGDTIRLGSAVQMKFSQPHPLSATARLDFVSRHQTRPSTDAIILMADACVLGPKRTNHIVCSDWPADVVLYRRGSNLYCRTNGAMEIDGVGQRNHSPISRNSRVSGDRFSLSLEAI